MIGGEANLETPVLGQSATINDVINRARNMDLGNIPPLSLDELRGKIMPFDGNCIPPDGVLSSSDDQRDKLWEAFRKSPDRAKLLEFMRHCANIGNINALDWGLSFFKDPQYNLGGYGGTIDQLKILKIMKIGYENGAEASLRVARLLNSSEGIEDYNLKNEVLSSGRFGLRAREDLRDKYLKKAASRHLAFKIISEFIKRLEKEKIS